MAAGAGSRYGTPKQYEPLGGRRVLDWSLAAARRMSDHVVLVVAPSALDRPEPDADVVVAGGATRAASVRAGVAALPSETVHVLVHDAARPVARDAGWQRVVDALRAGADAVVPAVPVTDTLREVDGAAVDRTRLVAVQTPQGFAVDVLRAAHAGGADATDDASLAEAVGAKVVLVEGDAANIKITEPWQLAVAEMLIR
ncbi:MAG: 2-C-methyl-D-erythritol 4-phosphate cytidylyltransferase [Gaiellaceae bacterium]|nr:2-C-methyl-D-erythritol 4-phosphate cytidylyltransferase [Gaiellaceae bacterium]